MKSLYLDEFNAVIRYHEIASDGPTIVYLAAVAFPSLPTFLPVATHASMRHHRGIFVDYFGVGHSEHPPDFDHSLQNHAKTVASVLDNEGVNDCVVVGHSMGGTVAIYLAMQRPDLVSHGPSGIFNISRNLIAFVVCIMRAFPQIDCRKSGERGCLALWIYSTF